MTLVCPIHTTKELTRLGSCVSCRKPVKGIPKPEPAPEPVQTAVAVMEPEPTPSSPNPTKTAAALRGERYRAKQKQLNPDFNEQEKKRRQIERSGKLVKSNTKAQNEEKRKEMLDDLLNSGQFPKSLALLRTKVGGGLFMKYAPQGKGQILIGDAALARHDTLRTDNLENTAPLRARPTEDELRAKLLSYNTESRIEILTALIDGDIQGRLPEHIEELLPKQKQHSLA